MLFSNTFHKLFKRNCPGQKSVDTCLPRGISLGQLSGYSFSGRNYSGKMFGGKSLGGNCGQEKFHGWPIVRGIIF